jgi:copper(I)-binding protein
MSACSSTEQTPEPVAATGRAGSMTVDSLYVPPPNGANYPTGSSATALITLINTAKDRDVLLGTSSPVAGSTLVQQDGRTNNRVNIPGENRTSRGLAVLMQDLTKPISPGDTVSVTLRFQTAGDLTLAAPGGR